MTPIKCYFLEPTDQLGFEKQPLFKRSDTGELITLADVTVGGMWFADWMLKGIESTPEYRVYRGDDDHCLVVRVPLNHDWMVDARCSNCTMKDDNVHKCWVRHGVPPDITVDKNGHTCQAGAGSIQVPGWHGFLTRGYLAENRDVPV